MEFSLWPCGRWKGNGSCGIKGKFEGEGMWRIPSSSSVLGDMIVCVAVVGHQNNPLYIQSFTEADDALKLHHIVHCSLDVVDERVNNPKKSGPTLNETFLGLLYPTENYKVYGYLTNTKVKFILVTTDLDVRDADVRNFFRRFHAAYVDAVSNPFHIPALSISFALDFLDMYLDSQDDHKL
ncbi:UNVERIFIED_CONTAM: Trafficking protein particle complex subunit-like protein [Sesamum calycinum]|uniref:Trafficking protein particle complex subunit 2-like protein n=1 Tax=Sesamum calycinum TaxID=2727403 RepID=A0AAW2PNF9_9LAMI